MRGIFSTKSATRQKKSQRFIAAVCCIIIALSMVGATAFDSVTENLPTVATDEITMTYNVTPDPRKNCRFDVKITVKAGIPALVSPPTLITFLLDGTQSMSATDAAYNSISRDVLARRGVIAALKTIKNEPALIQTRTFINVIIFGSVADDAASLTRWGRGSYGTIDGTTGALPPFFPQHPTPSMNDLQDPSLSTISSADYRDFVPFLDSSDLSGNTVNPILAELFNFNPITMAELPDPSATGPLSSVYFYGNASAAFPPGLVRSDRFPMSISGTTMNGGMAHVYKSFDSALNAVSLNHLNDEMIGMAGHAALSPGDDDPEATNKYVLVLADGDDSTTPGTQSWAAAITSTYQTAKLPVINTFNFIGNPIVAGDVAVQDPGAPHYGLGARIWSLVLNRGADGPLVPGEDMWRNRYPGSPSGSGTLASGIARGMISLAAPIGDGTDFTKYVSAVNGAISNPTDWAEGYNTYKAVTANNTAFGIETKFLRASSVQNALDFFTDFGSTATINGGLDHGAMFGEIDSHFFLDPTSFTTRTDTPTSPTPTVDVAPDNASFTWSLERMEPLEEVTLEYTFELKDEFKGDENPYDSVKKMFISYRGTQNPAGIFAAPYVINFPNSNISLTSTCLDPSVPPTTNPPPVNPHPPIEVVPEPDSGFLFPYLLAPHTPNIIIAEIVDEGLAEFVIFE